MSRPKPPSKTAGSRRASPLLWLGAAFGGLAAGAGAAHLLYTRGHKIGMDMRVFRPDPPELGPPQPQDFEDKEPGRGRMADRPCGSKGNDRSIRNDRRR